MAFHWELQKKLVIPILDYGSRLSVTQNPALATPQLCDLGPLNQVSES